jgi:hypothetical protein
MRDLTTIVITAQLAGALGCVAPVAAQQSADRVWRTITPPTGILSTGVPASARLIAGNVREMAARLTEAPVDTGVGARNPGVELFLPAPRAVSEAPYIRMRVHESPVLTGEAAARLRTFKTYSGRGIDDPTITARFEVTPGGMRGIVTTPRGEFSIAPAAVRFRVDSIAGEVTHAAIPKDEVPGRERQDSVIRKPTTRPPPARGRRRVPEVGTQLTFRLAVTATKEYSAFHRRGAPNDLAARDSALISIARTINLVQRIYERDLSVRFVLVPDEDKLVFVNTDPFSSGSLSRIREENQAVIDRVIGSAGYDLGHVLTTTDGGEATLAGICEKLFKAEGLSGLSQPVETEPFAVDYVAHEMGHQLGANHTFNGISGSCTTRTRYGATAVEPGSGTTIMAYAGICSPMNVELHSGSYFHGVSLAEIGDELAEAGCGVGVATGNRPPQVVVGSLSIYVPPKTPFLLAGSATDADGDVLTFTWEEMPGASWPAEPMPPHGDADGKVRPLFRSLPPSSSPERYFPALPLVVSGGTSQYELLPARERLNSDALLFQLTARDGRGGIGMGTTLVHVAGTRAFRVTAPAVGTRVRSGTSVTVVWDVAATDVAPISCKEVDVLFSSDGRAFQTTLARRMRNSGRENFTITSAASSTARLLVRCSTGGFFNVSPSFVIE